MTAPAKFKQLDISRALKAAQELDPPARVILDFKAGRIEFAFGAPDTPASNDEHEENPWEEDARP